MLRSEPTGASNLGFPQNSLNKSLGMQGVGPKGVFCNTVCSGLYLAREPAKSTRAILTLLRP